MKTTNHSFGFLPVALVLLALLLATGCIDQRYIIRDVDQHHAGEFNTIQTSGERVVTFGAFDLSSTQTGLNYWNCHQTERRVICNKACDEFTERLCRPELRHTFGIISKPDSGVAVARYIASTSGSIQEEWDTGLQDEQIDADADEVAGESDDRSAESDPEVSQ